MTASTAVCHAKAAGAFYLRWIMNELECARKTIGEIDREIAQLFCRRMRESERIAEYKRAHGLPIYDGDREEALIERNSAYIDDQAIVPYYTTFQRSVMNVSKQYQRRLTSGMRVAYSGVPGAFANIACRRVFPDGEAVAHGSFRSAYDAVVKGDCDCAVLPIENSYAGDVSQVVDLMFSGSLFVNGVYDLPVTHHLLAPEGAKLSDIETVVSHPQALSQCESYIKKHGFRAIEATNTAIAARAVAEGGDIRTAAIASAETAELYGLAVLDHDINDSNTNTTRFAVFSSARNEYREADGSNFLLMFTVKNAAGALARAISIIGEHGFNMKVLRSHPMKTLAWQYYFYIEAEGSPEGENGERMLTELAEVCDKLKVVGSYNAETGICSVPPTDGET